MTLEKAYDIALGMAQLDNDEQQAIQALVAASKIAEKLLAKLDASPIHRVFGETDWLLLAQQKRELVNVLGCLGMLRSEAEPALEGLLNWIDELQDAAEEEDYPVVFLTETEEKAQ